VVRGNTVYADRPTPQGHSTGWSPGSQFDLFDDNRLINVTPTPINGAVNPDSRSQQITTTEKLGVRDLITVTPGSNVDRYLREREQPGVSRDGTDAGETLQGSERNDLLRGLGGDDRLIGGPGQDTLDGGTGVDTLEGGWGDDLYIVDDAGDVVIELAGRGRDTVRSSVGYTLPDHVEDLALTGEGNLLGRGNGLANRIEGNAGANRLSGEGGDDLLLGGAGRDVLDGGDGDDTLDGGDGRDVLIGGDGADLFVLGHADAVDVIADFDLAEGDRLRLDFAALREGAGIDLDRARTQASGRNLLVQVDLGGDGGFTTIASLTGVAATPLAQLLEAPFIG
jgi:Ca2+-binding RTX toxin-like protein